MVAKKSAVRFVCSACGSSFGSWSGRCSVCGQWNTLIEEAVVVDAKGSVNKKGVSLKPELVKNVSGEDKHKRMQTGIGDVDLVLGGGFVAGSITLIAGQPGIGKSTLLLQIISGLSSGNKVLYVSGEESVNQVGLRAKRLGVADRKIDLISSTNCDDIARTINSSDYDFVVIDSIQTLTTESVASVAGSVSQITNCAHMIIKSAKKTNTAVVLVGHVTKEGSIAGPKVLEHVVDTVLQLEGDRYGGFKILRSAKNRYGSTEETGIFEMKNSGLEMVSNPSEAMLAERQDSDGSIVLATMEGSRPILVEVQALVNKTSYGYPKRAISGGDLNRLNLLIAMLERRTKLNLADKDVYINIVGGLKITDPGLDLAVAMAIGSADKGLKLRERVVVYGELGLSGEVRHVPFADKRLSEAKKLGFEVAIGPKSRDKSAGKTILQPVSDVKTALNTYLKI